MDADPPAYFELQFFSQEMTWDPTMDFPTFITTTDKLAEFHIKEFQPVNPNTNQYLLDFTKSPEEEHFRHPPREDDDFISKLNSTLAKAAQQNVYKHQNLSMKRKRSIMKRSKVATSNFDIEP